MNDPSRRDRQGQGWSDPTQPVGNNYPAYPSYPQNPDPAYSGQTYGGQSYGPPHYGQGNPPPTSPTEQLPTYWQPGTGYGGYGSGEPPAPPPGGPKSPKWLWIAAITAVVLVAGLVIALVIVTGSSKESAVMAPLPPLSVSTSAPSMTTTRTTPTTTSRSPSTTTSTAPTTTSATTSPTGTDSVVYTVSGEGRAINITYVDNGGVMQTEFNVMLPWTKQVSLSSPARGSASVAIVNVGRDVTCSVSINGAQVRERTGRGLTICTGAS